MNKLQEIYSFDSTLCVHGYMERPDRYRNLFSLLGAKNCIPRGKGLSYALASGGNQITSISSVSFNRILGFDLKTGMLVVEPGITIGEVLSFLTERGYWLPVVPGHPTITIGGCIAFNVHGKSQFHYGCFADYVEELTIFHSTHKEFTCSRLKAKEIFDLTCGGMWLTGFITSAKIKCIPLKGNGIKRRRLKVSNIWETAEAILANKTGADQLYSWNNFNLFEKEFGRGFLFLEEFSSIENSSTQSKQIIFNDLFPPPRTDIISRVLPIMKNHIAFAYEISEKIKPNVVQLKLLEGAFPINGKEIYHKLFGRKGLFEAQFIIPLSKWDKVSCSLKALFEKYQPRAALGSLKLFSGQQRYLNFCDEGFCISFDIPANDKNLNFLNAIDSICIENQCIPSIAKDSRLPFKVVRNTYSQYMEFKEDLYNYDPQRFYTSEVALRLDL